MKTLKLFLFVAKEFDSGKDSAVGYGRDAGGRLKPGKLRNDDRGNILEKETTFSCFQKSAALINSFGLGGRESKGGQTSLPGV